MGPAEGDAAAQAADTRGSALTIEVVCSPEPGVVEHWSGAVPAGTTARGAVDLCGLPDAVSALTRPGVTLGVWGRRCEPETPLRAGDRVEICRPLRMDPKEARRRRLREQTKTRRA